MKTLPNRRDTFRENTGRDRPNIPMGVTILSRDSFSRNTNSQHVRDI